MDAFQKVPLSTLELDGIVDLDTKLGSCSAQEILATLMLHSHDPIKMQQVLNALNADHERWDSFAMGPALPRNNQIADPGTLACLRDLWTGWNANTLYLLTPDAQTARSFKALAKGWECTDIAIYPPRFARYLTNIRTSRSHLVSIYWQKTVYFTEEMDFSATYDLAPLQFEYLQPLHQCSPQGLVAGLFLRYGRERIHAPTILQDLQAHSQLWYSFVVGPALPTMHTELANCLRGLSTLPDYYWIDCLYLWSRSLGAAEQLRALSQNWRCKSVDILDRPETARLLALPKGPPIVVVSW